MTSCEQELAKVKNDLREAYIKIQAANHEIAQLRIEVRMLREGKSSLDALHDVLDELAICKTTALKYKLSEQAGCLRKNLSFTFKPGDHVRAFVSVLAAQRTFEVVRLVNGRSGCALLQPLGTTLKPKQLSTGWLVPVRETLALPAPSPVRLLPPAPKPKAKKPKGEGHQWSEGKLCHLCGAERVSSEASEDNPSPCIPRVTRPLAEYLTTKQVCAELGISHSVMVRRAHVRHIYPVAVSRNNVYYWSKAQLPSIAASDRLSIPNYRPQAMLPMATEPA